MQSLSRGFFLGIAFVAMVCAVPPVAAEPAGPERLIPPPLAEALRKEGARGLEGREIEEGRADVWFHSPAGKVNLQWKVFPSEKAAHKEYFLYSGTIASGHVRLDFSLGDEITGVCDTRSGKLMLFIVRKGPLVFSLRFYTPVSDALSREMLLAVYHGLAAAQEPANPSPAP